MKAGALIVSFTLIIGVIAWIFGTVNFEEESYVNIEFEEQAGEMGAQFMNSISGITDLLKQIADGAMAAFNMIGSLITTLFNGIEKIADILGVDVFFENLFNPRGHGISGPGFGGGGGSSW